MNEAYRNGSAALERVAVLEHENAGLREELLEVARLRIEVGEIAELRADVDRLRARERGVNEQAYLKRLVEERDELHDQVRELRAKLATQVGELAKLRFQAKVSSGLGWLEGLLDGARRDSRSEK